MRFDKWFKYFWTINLSFLILSLVAAGYYVLIENTISIQSIIDNPFDLLSHSNAFPLPVVLLFFLPFFLSGYVILAMGIIEVYTSKKTIQSKVLWIVPMVVFGVIITVIYFFFYGRDKLTK
jgi:hypothetical protein